MQLPPIVALTPDDARDLAPWIVALGDAGLPALLVRLPRRPLHDVRRVVSVALDHVPTVWLHVRSPHEETLLTAVHGVHLPDAPSTAAPRGPWGRSCHTPAAVGAAFRAGASWSFLSPIHPPTSKPDDPRATLGPGVFASLPGPTYALGGMTPARHVAAVNASAAGSAVLGDLFGQADPQAAAARLRAWLDAVQNAKISS